MQTDTKTDGHETIDKPACRLTYNAWMVCVTGGVVEQRRGLAVTLLSALPVGWHGIMQTQWDADTLTAPSNHPLLSQIVQWSIAQEAQDTLPLYIQSIPD